MKKLLKPNKKALKVSFETIRDLGDSHLTGIAGGSQSNNGCGHSLSGSTFVNACQF